MRILSVVHPPLTVALEDRFHEEFKDRHLLLGSHVGDFKLDSDKVIESYNKGEMIAFGEIIETYIRI